MARHFHPVTSFWFTVGVVVGLCQLVRILLTDSTILNHGLAFSINLPKLFIFGVMVLFIGLMIWLFYSHRQLGQWWSIALGFIVGGGISNLTDRIMFNGGVADYWQLGKLSTINLADVAVTVGIIIAVYLLTIPYGTHNHF